MKLKFSDRIGETIPPNKFQLKEINDKLRNRLWNKIREHFLTNSGMHLFETAPLIVDEYFGLRMEEVYAQPAQIVNWFSSKFFASDFIWYDVYNLIQYLVDNFKRFNKKTGTDEFCRVINEILDNELSGYRFVDRILVPVTNEIEIKEIEKAITEADEKKLFGAGKQIETSLRLLGQKPEPDYRNSIKESISAIESVVKQITGEKGGGLDKALNILDEKVKFHQAFKQGLSKLYGYTSDEKGGIRHAIIDETDIGFDEAKFMLVSCSALVNFLIAKSEKAGLLKNG